MKKIFALILVLAFSLTFAACAEQNSYIMTAISDADGNVLASMTDDGNAVVDAEGNDVTDSYPILVLVVNSDDMTCAFGTEDAEVNGTYEVTAEDTETNSQEITFTLEDGEVLTMVYAIDDDTYAYAQDDAIVYLMNYNTFA